MQKSHTKHITVEIAVKIEYVTLDGRFGCVFKCRPDADVCYALSPSAVDQRGSSINAVTRDDAIVWFEVGGRKADRVATAVTANDHSLDAVRAAKHPPGEIDPALGQEFTDL